MVSEKAIKEATRRLVDKSSPKTIILFGSQARGKANEHSDVDFLVVCSVRGSRRALMIDMDRTLRGIGFARDIIL